ncbi:alpha/beta hydrolase [Myroides injenensis]|uniref:alpha/beta hydrolase n=1 Tax=Myroides injenensis TaxID=1183151 RepID=UPI0002896EBA|nr:alpha/beta hydrolase-fold protein [Myroides injenensis]
MSKFRLLALSAFTFIIGITSISAQENIVIGQTFPIKATKLNEDREIQIYLPKSYSENQDSTQAYPVIYLLDGESNFNYLSAFIEKLSRYPYPAIPEMIIVGVKNTNRTRDLTPSQKREETMNKAQKDRIQRESGGNDIFFSFLKDDLMPYIDNKYRTTGYNILIGHSFGGITALNNLLNYTDMFNAYIVHDPSVWWDAQYVLKDYQNKSNHDFKKRKLFLTQVGERESGGHLSDHYTSIKQFKELLDNSHFKNLSYQYQQYDDEDHSTIVLKGNLDGLRYLFEDYRVNFKELKTNPNLLKDAFAKVSAELDFSFYPSEAYLKSIVSYFVSSDAIKTAEETVAYCLSIYPDSDISDLLKKKK